mmetsp:Transcript_7962/g.23517  ORF Transcript_7962/g.23517 Transcript_7962/m.23517 type:complete len:560 (+) Transcript_7962:122-1801(+)
MGNQHSSSSSNIDIDRIRPFSRNGGSLGLPRNELDKRCQPSGLYGACHWDDKAIRRLIGDGKLAARQKGEEYPDKNCNTEECPICFLSYSAVNITSCCSAVICTECFLQVRPQKQKESSCPFCNSENFSVTIATKNNCSLGPGTLSSSSSLTTASLSTSSTSTSDAKDSAIAVSVAVTVNAKKKSTASVAPDTPPAKPSRFGSELEKDERVKKFKKRSESFASTSGSSTPKKDKEIIESIAMTTEERQRLEEEMKAQHYHPLVLRIEAEAQERRLQNDRAYRRSTGGFNPRSETAVSRRPRVRGGSARNWAQLANFLEGEEIDSIEAFERAIMHTVGERNARSAGNNNNNNNSDDDDDDDDDDDNRNRRNLEQQEGFPLLRTLLTGQLDINNWGASGDSEGAGSNFAWTGRRSYVARASNGPGMGLDASNPMVLSEEEQISMAIAASMRDQERQDAANQNNDEDGEGNDDTPNDNSDRDDADENDPDGSELTPGNQALTADVDLNVDVDVDVDVDAVADSEVSSQPLKEQSIGNEASTITELARVVTDTRAPTIDGIVA